MRPRGIPTDTAKIIAMIVSSTVVGRRSISSVATGRECLIDDPRSPLRQLAQVGDELVVEERRRDVLDAELDVVLDLEEAGDDCLVQAVADDEGVADGVGGALAEHGPARVARDDPGEDEHDEDDPDQDGDRDEEPADDEAGHSGGGFSNRVTGRGMLRDALRMQQTGAPRVRRPRSGCSAAGPLDHGAGGGGLR